MADTLTESQRHYVMSQVHSASTKPELTLRHALWRLGFRYRVNDKRLPGKPDIVLPKYRTVVFVHGCFWHGHTGCGRYTIPKTNTEFWMIKIARNQARDQKVWRRLEAHGWSVIVVWECELDKAHLPGTVERVADEIVRCGEAYSVAEASRRAVLTEYRLSRRDFSTRTAAHIAEIKNK